MNVNWDSACCKWSSNMFICSAQWVISPNIYKLGNFKYKPWLLLSFEKWEVLSTMGWISHMKRTALGSKCSLNCPLFPIFLHLGHFLLVQILSGPYGHWCLKLFVPSLINKFFGLSPNCISPILSLILLLRGKWYIYSTWLNIHVLTWLQINY